MNRERVVWLNASPSLKLFDRPIIDQLSQSVEVERWQYRHSLDQGSSIDLAVEQLRDYLKGNSVHLIGHGLSGIVGLQFARQYPNQARSMTLLGVSSKPATTWQAHYYVQRQLLPCSQTQLLVQTIRNIFGKQLSAMLPFESRFGLIDRLVSMFERDLEEAPALHSLFEVKSLPQGGVDVPLLICGSKTDPVVNLPALRDWQRWLKAIDQLWICESGSHFFHYFYAQPVAQEILNFWQIQNYSTNASTLEIPILEM